jgi:transcription antitermination factor NusG
MHDRPPEGQSLVEQALFPGYVFFKCDFVEWRTIYAVPGVLAIVRDGASIGIVRTREIENLRRVVDSGIPCELWPQVRGRSVTVEDGPLRGISGVLANTIEKHRLVIPVSLIDLSLAFEIDDSWGLSQAYPQRSEISLRHHGDQIGSP